MTADSRSGSWQPQVLPGRTSASPSLPSGARLVRPEGEPQRWPVTLEVTADLVAAMRMAAGAVHDWADHLEERASGTGDRAEALDGLGALRNWAEQVQELSDLLEEQRSVPRQAPSE